MGGLECTSLAYPSAKLMGQTWDWAERLEELAVILRITKPDGRRLLMLVEPGMLGKLGMNSSGLGVCINFLESPVPFTPGVPFHVLSRLALEETSLEGALGCVNLLGGHAAGHLLIAGTDGRGASVELAGPTGSIGRSVDVLAHTNHYLHLAGGERGIARIDSDRRLARVRALAQESPRTLEDLQRILQDRKGLCSICRRYLPSFGKAGEGTVAVIGMDLDGGAFAIKRGHSRQSGFITIAV